MRRRRCIRGFTLIEAIVSTIVLAIGGVAAMLAISACTRSVGVAGDYSKAALLAEKRIAELSLQTGSLNSGEQQGDFGDEYPGFAWIQTVEPTDYAGVSRITLVVTWPLGVRQGRAVFVTLLREKPSA
ncbi:MAG: prepilin-type N-terminal cleavage/methylation domain-containing protein [Chthonomonadales bacterium]|nr:prepilin-type N-terminal cleavage/methylation domain-containing protein [Chthonomonadales bacterium]